MPQPPPVPELLFHYYEKARGPFLSLSDIDPDQAAAILEQIRAAGIGFASQRAADYLAVRRELEDKIRRLFIAKGGAPKRARPHYLILGAQPWVKSWYQEGAEVCIPLAQVDPGVISFTYGDSFPAMRYLDGKPYRGQVYTLAELPALVARFGLPQDWNPDGRCGPERYIEAQVWDDAPIRRFQ